MAIRLQGAEAINARLREIRQTIGERATGGVLYKSLNKASTPMMKQAKDTAPLDTGNVKARIRRKRATTGEYAHRQGAAVAIYVQTKAWYYIFHEEYGARGRPPIPFLRPAFEQHKDEAVDTFGVEINRHIDRVWQ